MNYFIENHIGTLQIIMEEENYFAHIGLISSMGNLIDLVYKSKIKEKSNLFSKMDDLNFVEFHPEKTFSLDKKRNKSIIYDFRIRQKKEINFEE